MLRVPEDISEDVGNLVKEGEIRQTPEEKVNSDTPAHIDVQPVPDQDDSSQDRFIVTFRGKNYPALLMNIPTPLEAQKVFDGNNILKSGDIGQMLQMFNTEEELLNAQKKIKPGYVNDQVSEAQKVMDSVMPSGITQATENIVKKRYELTRKRTNPPTYAEVSSLTQEMSSAFKFSGRAAASSTV